MNRDYIVKKSIEQLKNESLKKNDNFKVEEELLKNKEKEMIDFFSNLLKKEP